MWLFFFHTSIQSRTVKSSHCWCLCARDFMSIGSHTYLAPKETCSFIAPVFRHLYNLSLQSGTFPQCLKEAMVYPRIKNPTWIQNKSYRPISNLSYISKIVERVVAKRFTAHVNALNFLPVHQSAYHVHVHHSTETAILSVYNAPLIMAKCQCSCYLILVRHLTLLIMTFCYRF